jgi:NADP-dependent 3-hydroxy acid dehydrogenase YdfG
MTSAKWTARDLPRLEGRTFVVTGANSGIGLAASRALGRAGARVVLAVRDVAKGEAAAASIEGRPEVRELDLADLGSVRAFADAWDGDLDVLVNNAGVMLLGPFSTDQRDDYRRMIEVNLLGAITTTEVFLDQLKTDAAERGGDIVNISSVAGRTARAGNGVYAATKWGLNGWSESLRQELLPDIRVTLIEPGVVATELPDHITHEETRHGVQQLYGKAEVTADDVAEIIAFTLGRPRHLAINEILLRPAGQI